MADVTPSSRRFLWYERLHAVDRHEGAWPEDLRGEPAHGGEIRLEVSVYRLLPPCPTAGRLVRSGVRERGYRPIREPPSRATRQGYLADGRRRDHRFLS